MVNLSALPRRLWVASALSVLMGSVPAAAENDRDVEQAGRPVVIISGPRAGGFESTSDTTGFSDVIDTEEVWRGYRSVGEVLDRSVGVRIRRFGGRDDFATVSVRGSTPQQVKILVDGVSMTRAKDAIVNLADLPMDAVERIEVYRGFTPVRFASSGAAGVINIITRRPTEPAAGGSATYGSFDSAKGSLFAAAPVARGTASAFFTYRRTDGDFEYVNDNGTPLNPDDDFTTRRRNNDFESYDLLARYITTWPGGSQLTISDQVFYKDEGTPGVATQEALRARFRETRNVFAANWQSPTAAVAGGFDFTFVDETLRDPESPGLGLPFPEVNGKTYALAGRTQASQAWGDFHFFELSVETGFEKYRGRFPGIAGAGLDEERNTLALAVGDDIHMPGLNLTVSPQLRQELLWNRFDGECAGLIPECDSPSSSESSTDPRIGVRWELTPDITIKGNIGTYFRPPTFDELFGADGFTLPNPTLRPETGTNRDIGILSRAKRLGPFARMDFEYAYFRNDADDLILLIGTGNQIPRPQNVGQARVEGHEFRLAVDGPAGLSLAANYTHQDAENRSRVADVRGNDLPGLPEDELYARVSMTRPRWSLSYELEYQSGVFLVPVRDPFKRVPSHTTHSLTVVLRPFAANFQVEVQAENLTDENYEDQWNFPTPGRAFYVTVSYALGKETGS